MDRRERFGDEPRVLRTLIAVFQPLGEDAAGTPERLHVRIGIYEYAASVAAGDRIQGGDSDAESGEHHRAGTAQGVDAGVGVVDDLTDGQEGGGYRVGYAAHERRLLGEAAARQKDSLSFPKSASEADRRNQESLSPSAARSLMTRVMMDLASTP